MQGPVSTFSRPAERDERNFRTEFAIFDIVYDSKNILTISVFFVLFVLKITAVRTIFPKSTYISFPFTTMHAQKQNIE